MKMKGYSHSQDMDAFSKHKAEGKKIKSCKTTNEWYIFINCCKKCEQKKRTTNNLWHAYLQGGLRGLKQERITQREARVFITF